MSNHIKNLINTAGWKDIEKMFNEQIIKLKSEDVDESLSGDNYKTTSLGNKKGAKHIQSLLNKIKLAGGAIHDKNISYK